VLHCAEFIQFIAEFVQFIIEFVQFITEFVQFIIEFVQFIAEFIQFITEFVQFIIEFVQFIELSCRFGTDRRIAVIDCTITNVFRLSMKSTVVLLIQFCFFCWKWKMNKLWILWWHLLM